MTTPVDPMREKLTIAALPHVAFDGWGPLAFDAATSDCGMDSAEAKQLCPRGALDLAVTFHRMGDAAMIDALTEADLSDMRFRDKVAKAISLRLKAVDDKEAVRRGTTLFALPIHAPEGAKLIWGTADAIWTTLGDTSEDVNWYTKRATLAAVYSAVVLYWLGDDSPEHQATEAFIDRRIENVMQIEKLKAGVRQNPLFRPFAATCAEFGRMMKPPRTTQADDLPGRWAPDTPQ